MRLTKYRLGDLLVHTPRPVGVEPQKTYAEIGTRSHFKGIFHKSPVSGASLGEKKVFYVAPGDFVLNIVFAWEGALAIASEKEAGKIASHRFPTFRVREDRAVPEYLLSLFQTSEGLALLLRVSPGGAGRNRTLNRTAFLDEVVQIPDVAAQREVAARLREIGDRVERVRTLREEALAELASAKLRLVLGNEATPNPRRPLSEVVDWIRETESVRAGTLYRFAGVRSFGRGVFRGDTRTAAQFKYPRLARLRPGDFVFPKLMAWEGAFGTVPEELDGSVVSPEFQIFRVKDPDEVLPEVLDTYFRSPLCLPSVRAASAGTNVRRRRLHPEDFLKLNIPVPSLAEQRRLREMAQLEKQLLAQAPEQIHELEVFVTRLRAETFAGQIPQRVPVPIHPQQRAKVAHGDVAL